MIIRIILYSFNLKREFTKFITIFENHSWDIDKEYRELTETWLMNLLQRYWEQDAIYLWISLLKPDQKYLLDNTWYDFFISKWFLLFKNN
jgi:hypothetical protein